MCGMPVNGKAAANPQSRTPGLPRRETTLCLDRGGPFSQKVSGQFVFLGVTPRDQMWRGVEVTGETPPRTL